jgi:hypothetical protein
LPNGNGAEIRNYATEIQLTSDNVQIMSGEGSVLEHFKDFKISTL